MNSSCQINGETRIYGIIGNPLEHSLSPLMQTAAFQILGVNAVYLPFPIREKDLPSILKIFSVIGLLGFNVTTPYKEKIIPFLDELSNEARILRSVNTVEKINDAWKGHNTDGSGFARWLAEERIEISGRNVLLVGAGGTGRSIALALASKNIGSLHIMNRTRSRAERTVEIVRQVNPDIPLEINPETASASYDLLISSVSAEMDGERSPISEDLIKKSDVIADVVYQPRQTALLKKAEKMSKPFFNGLGMLAYQGAEAFEIWTGRKAPTELMRKLCR